MSVYHSTPDLGDDEVLSPEEFKRYLASLPRSKPMRSLDSPEAWATWRSEHPIYRDPPPVPMPADPEPYEPTTADRLWLAQLARDAAWDAFCGEVAELGPEYDTWLDRIEALARDREWEDRLAMMHDPRNIEA